MLFRKGRKLTDALASQGINTKTAAALSQAPHGPHGVSHLVDRLGDLNEKAIAGLFDSPPQPTHVTAVCH